MGKVSHKPVKPTDSVTGKPMENTFICGATRAINPSTMLTSNSMDTTGSENIKRTYQAEWSYNCGILGYAWDETAGGKSPTDTAIGTSTNWKKIATSNKDTAGVLLASK